MPLRVLGIQVMQYQKKKMLKKSSWTLLDFLEDVLPLIHIASSIPKDWWGFLLVLQL